MQSNDVVDQKCKLNSKNLEGVNNCTTPNNLYEEEECRWLTMSEEFASNVTYVTSCAGLMKAIVSLKSWSEDNIEQH